MTVRFDDALLAAIALVRDSPPTDVGELVLVRDLFGRLRAVVEKEPTNTDALSAWNERLQSATGSYFAGPPMIGTQMVAPDAVFKSPDCFDVGGVKLLERGVMGAEWTRAELPNREPKPPRATLYGLKGGVGRSTAICAWSRHLANNLGRKVLVIDLDLESPGVSSTLLPTLGDFGIVDWFVEDAVGNADDELVRRLAVSSPLATGQKEILVVPCAKEGDRDYISKLARCYLDLPGPTRRPFADRIADLVDKLEEVHKPDVVLIDSRAGLHDLAGIATSRLDAMTFLFGTSARQTWSGYRMLFEGLARNTTTAAAVREKLRVVAAQIPETHREEYLERVTLRAYDAFEPLYDESDVPDAFNFDVGAEDAPHYPIPIFWSREFQEWDPLSDNVTAAQIEASFGDFVNGATDLLLDTKDAVS